MSEIQIPPTLSVCLIVKDEAQTLVACLESVTAIADQLVVIDTGSQDQSSAIASRYGAEVYTMPWEDDFSAARNAAIARATQDWILFIDADEVLINPDFKKCLAAISRQLPDALPRLQIRIHNLNDTGQVESIYGLIRVFRNQPGFAYTGRIHEQLSYQGPQKSPIIPVPQIQLLHSGYTSTALQRKNKAQRNIALLTLQLQTEPGQPNWHSYLADSLRLLKTPEADQQAREHYALAVKQWPAAQMNSPRFSTTLSKYLKHLLRVQGPVVAAQLAEQYLERSDLEPDFVFFSGEAYWQLGQATKAQACFERCLLLAKTPEKIPGAYTLACLQELPLARLVHLNYAASLKGESAAAEALQRHSRQLLALNKRALDGMPVYLFWVVGACLQNVQEQGPELQTPAEQGLWAAWQCLKHTPPEWAHKLFQQQGLSHPQQVIAQAERLWELQALPIRWLVIGMLFLSCLDKPKAVKQTHSQQIGHLLKRIGQTSLARQLRELLLT